MQKEEYILTNEQQHQYDVIVEGKRNTINISEAGFGKSVLIDRLKKDLHKDTLFLSTTGTSALNIGGSTMHKGMSLPIGIVTKETLKKVSQAVAKLFATGTIKRIVCDEFSMITSPAWYGFMERIKRFNKATSKRPERDIKVHLFGDILQLGEVTRDEELPIILKEYGATKFYNMQSFIDRDFKLFEFTEGLRQKDPEMKKHLSVIRTASPIGYDKHFNKVYDTDVLDALAFFNQRYVNESPEDATIIASTKAAMNTYNRISFEKSPNEIGTYTADVTGDYSEKDVPCGGDVSLKVGLNVMILKNSPYDSEVSYTNGDIGEVLDMEEEGATIRLARTGEEVLIEPTEWEKFAYEVRPEVIELEIGAPVTMISDNNSGTCKAGDSGEIIDVYEQGFFSIKLTETGEVLEVPSYAFKLQEGEMVLTQYVSGTATGIPLRLSACINVHKTQGATLDKAIVDLGSNCTFATAMVYVALSRLRTLEGLFLRRKITTKDLNVDLEAIKWLKEMRAKNKLTS